MNEVPVNFGETLDQASMNQSRASHKRFDAERRAKDAQLLLDAWQESTSEAMEVWKRPWER